MNTSIPRTVSFALFSLLSGAAAPCLAGDVEAIFADVATVQDGRGQSRILFRPTPIPFDEFTVIERAVLRIPFTGTTETRNLPLRVCVVTQDWSQGATWETEFDARLFARTSVDLRAGSGVAVFDVTALMKEILEDGAPADGFVLTGGEKGSPGIRVTDSSRFASFTGAQLEITTTMFPSKRPQRAYGEENQGSE